MWNDLQFLHTIHWKTSLFPNSNSPPSTTNDKDPRLAGAHPLVTGAHPKATEGAPSPPRTL